MYPFACVLRDDPPAQPQTSRGVRHLPLQRGGGSPIEISPDVYLRFC